MKNLIKIYCSTLCLLFSYNTYAQTEARYYTSMGSFKVVLTDTLTPRTVDSFIARVSEHFYDGLIFHRVIDSFMIQGGDPLGTGSGGPGYTIPDEFDPTLKNVPGALAMANAGPNTNGCQFYINLVNNTHLNNHYTVFGMVTENFSVVQSIGHVPTNTNDKPLTDVVMDSIRITHYPAAVNNITKGANPLIYPNPCRGVFSIDLAGVGARVEIVNMQGCLVYAAATKGVLKVDLTDQPTGLYIVRITTANGTSENRLIVQ